MTDETKTPNKEVKFQLFGGSIFHLFQCGLTMVFVLAKLGILAPSSGFTHTSWWIVFSPLYAPIVVIAGGLLGLLGLGVVILTLVGAGYLILMSGNSLVRTIRVKLHRKREGINFEERVATLRAKRHENWLRDAGPASTSGGYTPRTHADPRKS